LCSEDAETSHFSKERWKDRVKDAEEEV
jgi:hypothetical protein